MVVVTAMIRQPTLLIKRLHLLYEFAVKLIVNKNGTLKLEKVYSAKTEFESSFAGAVAIPNGQNEYPKLIQKLLKTIYTDNDFVNLLKK